jgi:hypothetical protein
VASSTGFCFCGCGHPVSEGRFFDQGHDATALRMLSAADGGLTLADRLEQRGLVGEALREAALMGDPEYETCHRIDAVTGRPCLVVGKGAGMRGHRASGRLHR